MAKQPAKKVATPVVENKTAINRAKRLARHLKQHPNDAQALVASKTTKAPRKASKAKGNFPTKKHKIRDDAGHFIGLANASAFYFTNRLTTVDEDGKLKQNPEIREVWSWYKSQLANAATKGRRKHV